VRIAGSLRILRRLSVAPGRLGFHEGIFLLLLAVAGAGCSRPAEDVVLITIDTLRADHVSAFAALDARGITSHALVVLTSDHGERLGRGGHWDHCASLGDEELRVPLFVRVNGGPLTGRRRETGQASTLDVVSTVLALLGTPQEAAPAVARDLRKLPDGRTALAFWHGRWAARRADWKLIAGEGGAPPELYEVARDPLEERNLASRGDPAEQDLTRVIEPLAGLGQRIENENSLPIEELRSLGYLE